MDKVFMILTSGDKEVHKEVSFKYAPNALKHKWMDQVRVILWGPTERLAAIDPEFQAQIKELVEQGVEVYACKACSDDYGVTETLISLDLDIKVKYVGKMVTEMLKEGWHQLSF
ncbi:MAG: DsrE family protein [Candidatus Hodarchaeales archaeon]